jgi:hypothetical protein
MSEAGAATFNAGVTVNESGADQDFRVESSGNASMLHVDGGDDVVNIGTSTDFGETFNVSGTGHFSSNVTLSRQSNDTGSTGLILEKTRNTSVNGNTVVQNGDQLGYVAFRGNDGDQFIDGAYVISFVDGTPGNNDMPTNLQFWTTADGANSPTERMRIDSSGNVGIGVTPESDWYTGYHMIQLAEGAVVGGYTDNSTYLGSNWKDDTNNKYINTDEASVYRQTAGTHIFQVAPSGSADAAMTLTTAMTIDNSGDVTVDTGNLVIGTAGKGIDFSANANAAGMTSELLDDYEEGTWTPTLVRSGTQFDGTYNGQDGDYVKIGNLVQFSALIVVSGVTTSGDGNIQISGLPFTQNQGGYQQVVTLGFNDTFDAAVTRGYMVSGNIQIIPTGITQANYAGVISTGYLTVSGCYSA